MKKIIIIAGIVIASGITALSFNKKDTVAKSKVAKIERSDFAIKSINAPMNDISTAD